MHIHTELPTGAQSRGYEVESEATAAKWFDRIKGQLVAMQFVGDLVLSDCGIDVRRETFSAAG